MVPECFRTAVSSEAVSQRGLRLEHLSCSSTTDFSKHDVPSMGSWKQNCLAQSTVATSNHLNIYTYTHIIIYTSTYIYIYAHIIILIYIYMSYSIYSMYIYIYVSNESSLLKTQNLEFFQRRLWSSPAKWLAVWHVVPRVNMCQPYQHCEPSPKLSNDHVLMWGSISLKTNLQISKHLGFHISLT